MGVVQLLQFQGTTRSREIFVGFGPPTGRQLSFSRGITSEKVEPCTEPRPAPHRLPAQAAGLDMCESDLKTTTDFLPTHPSLIERASRIAPEGSQIEIEPTAILIAMT